MIDNKHEWDDVAHNMNSDRVVTKYVNFLTLDMGRQRHFGGGICYTWIFQLIESQ